MWFLDDLICGGLSFMLKLGDEKCLRSANISRFNLNLYKKFCDGPRSTTEGHRNFVFVLSCDVVRIVSFLALFGTTLSGYEPTSRHIDTSRHENPSNSLIFSPRFMKLPHRFEACTLPKSSLHGRFPKRHQFGRPWSSEICT